MNDQHGKMGPYINMSLMWSYNLFTDLGKEYRSRSCGSGRLPDTAYIVLLAGIPGEIGPKNVGLTVVGTSDANETGALLSVPSKCKGKLR
jgi:hypothetical protein